MSSSRDEILIDPPKQSNKQQRSEKAKRRTPRACDQCRLKKAKCDGQIKCRTCKTSGRTCAYTTRRGREARNYYYRIRDINEEALQTLYAACRKAGNFPGSLPMEDKDGLVTTNAILEGLGLIESTVDEQGLPRTLITKPTKAQKEMDLAQSGNAESGSVPVWTSTERAPYFHTRSFSAGDQISYMPDLTSNSVKVPSLSSNEHMVWHNQPIYGIVPHSEPFSTISNLNNPLSISTGFVQSLHYASEHTGSSLDPASLYAMSDL